MSFESQIYSHHAAASPLHLEQRLRSALARLSGGGLLFIVALLWLSLLSWSVTDPSLTHATSGTTRNLMGALGAIVSDLLLQSFGIGAVVALIVLAFWGLALLNGEPNRRSRAKSRILFFPVALFAVAGALSALPSPASWPLHHGLGGIVGDTVFTLVANIFGLINSARGGIAAAMVLFFIASFSVLQAVGLTVREIISAVRRSGRTTTPPIAPRHNVDFGDVRLTPDQTPSQFDPVSGYEPQLPGGAQLTINGLGPRVSRAFATAREKTAHGFDLVQHQAKRFGAGLAHRAPLYGEAGHHQNQGHGNAGQTANGSYASTAAPGYQQPSFGHPDNAAPGPMSGSYPGVYQGSYAHQPAPPHHHDYAKPPIGVRAPSRGPASQLGNGPAHDARGEGPYDPSAFEVATEDSSRAIARRFAPANAAAAYDAEPLVMPNEQIQQSPIPPRSRPVREPAPQQNAPTNAAATAPAGAAPTSQKRNALFGGLTFRGQAGAVLKQPPLTLLKKVAASKAGPEFTQTVLRGNARLLEDVLSDFGVKGEVRDIRPGPVVTLFELEPARGTKSSRVIGLADDIARSMSATSVRVAVVPGRNAIGIELPNVRRETVLLRELLESEPFKVPDQGLPIALGKSIGGEPIVADLARMPHLLVAGTTGSGKSVGVNAMILSLLYKMSPDDCRFLMIDPKMLELSVYNGIPHLLAPVVTDPQKAVTALNWVVGEMEERYKRMSKLSVRNIDVFNNRVRNAKKRGEMISRTVQTGFDRRTGEAVYEQEQMQLETMPYIVVVIDEFADLMLVAGKEVEASVQRLAQMARAAGIHIIMATQRPSVDVITGTIKANFPTRISFKVTSKIDSRTILNEQGAEQLLGQGDMLFAAGNGQISRVHGAFVSDEEVEAITNFLRSQGTPKYVIGITDAPAAAPTEGEEQRGHSEEDLYDRAVAIVLRDRKASTSYIQRRLSIGYNRAADLIERMEAEGLISAANNVGKREILAPASGGEPTSTADAA